MRLISIRFQLDVEVQKSAKTKDNVNFKFDTKQGSRIYLLAYDKRLTYLRKGNEVTKTDVVKEVADVDEHNKITVFKMEAWHDCTQEELDTIEKGRVLTTSHGGDVFSLDDSDDFEEDFGNPNDDPQASGETKEADDIREDFPETWIYEDFVVEENKGW